MTIRLPAVKWVLSCAAAALGAVYYLGWVFRWDWLTHFPANQATMKPVTAALFVLSGVTLNFLPCARSKLSPLRVQISTCFAAAILAIVAGSFCDAATSWRIGVARLFVSEIGPSPHAVAQGAPSIGTLAAFALVPLAVAVWNYSSSTMARTMRGIGGSMVTIGVVGLALVACGVPAYAWVGVSSAMSPVTAVGIVALGLDIYLFSRATVRVYAKTPCSSWEEARAMEESKRTHLELCASSS